MENEERQKFKGEKKRYSMKGRLKEIKKLKKGKRWKMRHIKGNKEIKRWKVRKKLKEGKMGKFVIGKLCAKVDN